MRLCAPAATWPLNWVKFVGGKVKLEEAVLPCGIEIGLHPELVMINDHRFTKTANCWGVNNNSKGTNSNRIVVFSKN
jgi:hypothetical protein